MQAPNPSALAVPWDPVARIRFPSMKIATQTRRHLAANLSRIMDERGLSTHELGKASGVSQRQVASVKKGRQGASVDTVDSLAKALKVPAWSLLLPPQANDLRVVARVQALQSAYVELCPRDRLTVDNLLTTLTSIPA